MKIQIMLRDRHKTCVGFNPVMGIHVLPSNRHNNVSGSIGSLGSNKRFLSDNLMLYKVDD